MKEMSFSMHRREGEREPPLNETAALRETLGHYQVITQWMKDLVVRWDMQLQPVFISPSVQDFLGYSVEECRSILGNAQDFDLKLFIAPGSYEVLLEELAERMGSDPGPGAPERQRSIELELIRKDGSRVWTETKGSFIRDEASRRIGSITVTRDISERKRGAEALLQAHRQYAVTLDAMHDYIHVVDRDLKIVLFNRAFRQWCSGLGYPTDVVGRNIFEAFHFLSPAIEEEYAAVFASGEVLETQEEGTHDGRLIVTETRKIPIIVDGCVTQVVTVIRDITHQKEAERRLRTSEERLRTVFQTTPDAITISLVEDGTFVEVNEGMCELTGYSRDEVIGKSVQELRLWERPADRNLIVDQLSRTGEVRNVETNFRRRDGRILPTLFSARRITLDGRSCLLTVARNIEGWKRDQAALRESERRYRLLAENLTETLWILDPEKGRFTYMSPAVWRIRGYSPQEALALPLEKTFAPDSLTKLKGEIKHLMNAEGSPVRSCETEVICRDGKTVWCEVTLSRLMDEGGDSLGILGVSRDIMERKRALAEMHHLEFQLMQAQKMEALGTMAGGIAHDFNNILAAIMGFTEIAQMKLPGESEAGRSLEKALGACERAKALINQILSFSRREDRESKPMQVAPIVKEALKMLRSSLPSSVEIRTQIDDPRAVVETDPTQIHQIVMNLCTNAAHAMPSGGLLTVRLSRVELGPANTAALSGISPGAYLLMQVTDTGQGMSPEVMEHIFEPYFTTKKEGEGTGLGLSVIHGIVRRHGGAITVESLPDEGTTFRVYLPRIEQNPGQKRPLPENPLPRGSESILFIDDEQALVDIGLQMLEYLGYQVSVRTSSTEALQLFCSQPQRFDLVITDMTMPNMTGDELARRITEIRPGMPVMLCTGFSERITPENIHHLGIRKLVMKPLSLRELACDIREVLDLPDRVAP